MEFNTPFPSLSFAQPSLMSCNRNRRNQSTHAVCRSIPVPVRACAGNGIPKPFAIQKTVMPVDTDYSGVLWHGSYVRYLEEARVEWLKAVGLRYDVLVRDNKTHLVVSDLLLRFRSPARMGDVINVSVELQPQPRRSVRLVVHSAMSRVDDGALLATADVTLAPVNTESGLLRRRLPATLAEILAPFV
eukprot:IDg15748t1